MFPSTNPMTQEIPVLTVLSSSQPDPKNPRAPWWTWERRLSRRSLRKASYLEGFAVFGEFHLEVWWILVINCKWTLFAELGGHLRPCYMKSQSWGLAVLLINGLIQAPFLPLNRIFRVQRDIGFQLPTHQTIEITYNYWYYIYIFHIMIARRTLTFAQNDIVYLIFPTVLTHVSSTVLTALQGWTVH